LSRWLGNADGNFSILFFVRSIDCYCCQLTQQTKQMKHKPNKEAESYTEAHSVSLSRWILPKRNLQDMYIVIAKLEHP
jgi:hypothetical protein